MMGFHVVGLCIICLARYIFYIENIYVHRFKNQYP